MFLTALKTVLIILEVLLIFNLMIIVHELGHFLAARWRGLVIEKFGIWFGKPLWKKTINGVEYSLGSIPAGGFVALPQLAPMEVMEGKVETPREQLPPISALDKIIVAFAGPLFSFLLAAVFAVIVWQVGRPMGEAESTTIVGEVGPRSPAAEAGILPGDKILSVDGHKVTRFGGMGADSVTWRVVRSEGESIAVEIERDGQVQTLNLRPVLPEKANWWNRKALRVIGVGPKVSAVIAKVEPGSVAEAAGLQKGDMIAAVNGQPLMGADDLYQVQGTALDAPLALTVERGGQTLPIEMRYGGVLVGGVQKNSPAEAGGLRPGDRIVAVDGQPTTVVRRFIESISDKAETAITLRVQRPAQPFSLWRFLRTGRGAQAAEELELKVTPQLGTVPGTDTPRALTGFLSAEGDGIGFLPQGRYRVVHPGPFEQIRGGVMSIVNTLDAVLSRKSSISVQHMGGPVMMMNAYYNILSGPEGIRMALWFSVVLNVNLALLNLLPIPVLDGGHITLALIESIRRKPVNVRLLEYVQTACAMVIIGFMVFIAFFDVQDLPFVGGGKGPQVQFKKAPAAETPR